MVKTRQRLLVIGMIDSPHLIRWLNEVGSLGRFSTIYIFPSTSPKPAGPLAELKSGSKFRVVGIFKNFRFTSLIYAFLDKTIGNRWRKIYLSIVIKIVRPHLIHVHELQHGGYLLSDQINFRKNVKLLCSTWGSDLVLYGKLKSHKDRLSKLLKRTDYLLTERKVDLEVARELGFIGKPISPSYATIGTNENQMPRVKPSARKKIVVKGYQDNHGRALNVLQALSLIHEELRSYEIVIISASESVRIMAEYMQNELSINIVCAPKLSRVDVMKLFEDSRVYIGLSISDGISNTMIESMQMGTFPIQSANSCAPDFIEDGIGGFVVEPWDISKIAASIKQALSDDLLVDSSVEANLKTLNRKFSRVEGLRILDALYQEILND